MLFAGISSMLVPAESRGFFNIFESFSALVLGWTLYAITREVDADLALLAMMCRVIEAVPGRGEIYFAVGSTIFCWLLLRGQMIHVALAWFGTATSAMLVVLLWGRRCWVSPRTGRHRSHGSSGCRSSSSR